MVGLEVIATFITSGQQSCIWAATSATAGGCSVAGLFSVVQDGDTFGLSNFWQLQNVSTFDVLTQLVLNGASGTGNTSGTVFDRTFGFTTGTPGSALGRDATGTTSTVADALAIYRNAVSVGAAAPVGDEFATLHITFGNGLTSGGSAAFVADTDTVGLSGVPEPGTAGVLGIGLLAIRAIGRRVVRR
ncbi:MAG: hypothetical protein H7039_19860 [Bryobacteraceae bacterium]|nr:hypothetical protein [Bryobacteraceae bacterium]